MPDSRGEGTRRQGNSGADKGLRAPELKVFRIKELKEDIIVTAFVKPSSRRDAIKISDELCVETREPPSRNRANLGVIKLLSKAAGVPGSSVFIIRGSTESEGDLHKRSWFGRV
ncbi:MAG: DUF167 domain-containing protein [Candidatus Verstraetearchaeota archaeon]|nr:DUF167 domain-containing protein [Candidatus Verstraetearchaeota archaeon]